MSDDDRAPFRLSLLGTWQLHWGDDVVRVAARQRRLIAALAISGPRPRRFLIGLLWPEYPESRALESLRVSVHLISRQVPGLVINSGSTLALNDVVDVDLSRVRQQLARLRTQGFNGDAASVLQLLRRADLLPGWYDEWVLIEQQRLRQDLLLAFDMIAHASLESRDYRSAIEAAEAALRVDPLYESAVGVLIEAERRQGNQSAALRVFLSYEASVRAEWGLPPSRAVGRLVSDLVRR